MLGAELDDRLSWSEHITGLTKSFVEKVNLLKALRFLLQHVRQDFYFKVILPAVTYGQLIWGSCNKTLLECIQRIHFRAARIIYDLPWCTPRIQVMNQHHWKPLTHFYNIKLGMFVHKCLLEEHLHHDSTTAIHQARCSLQSQRCQHHQATSSSHQLWQKLDQGSRNQILEQDS